MNKGHYRHLLRALILVAGACLVFFLLRAFLIPRSFGKYGFFRGDNLKEQADIPVVHGNPQACAECHDEQVKMIASGPHAGVPCQDCHAPLTQHITEEGIVPMPITRSYALCARCHQKLDARPKTFPQIDFQDHVAAKGKNWESEDICLNCHRSHNPLKKK
ncbi:MAG: cytochrome c3 family protein [Deltaproteobacteria bacterium]|nr:cytochrome c3 family protein [Deltaproteobacteria bacterium]